jgi:hypothetical protein
MDIERNLAPVGFPADTFKKTNSLSLELIIMSNKLKNISMRVVQYWRVFLYWRMRGRLVCDNSLPNVDTSNHVESSSGWIRALEP